jgi:copper chaperone
MTQKVVFAHTPRGYTAVMGTTEAFRVSGMTCAHCVAAVSSELAKVPGVLEVRVDLESGVLRISTAGGALDEEQVRAAIDEAGYDLVGPVVDA